MQSVSDDIVWKKLLEKLSFELVAKGIFRLGRCYILLALHLIDVIYCEDAEVSRYAVCILFCTYDPV